MREEHIGQAKEMVEVHGEFIGGVDQLDPLEILMLLEERARNE
jgi:hypothetical protein